MRGVHLGILLLCISSSLAKEWWQNSIVYQVYPRSFQDSDGDGTGDIKGIQSRLPYLSEIGIETVWISPVYKSPMADFGYDISDFMDIDPIFGTLADFKTLVESARELGIKIVMDFVPNHSSDQHEWFTKSVAQIEPYTDYYIWKDPSGFDQDGTPLPPNNWVRQRTLSYAHAFLRARYSTHTPFLRAHYSTRTLFYAHAFLRARFFTRAPSYKRAFLRARFLTRTLPYACYTQVHT